MALSESTRIDVQSSNRLFMILVGGGSFCTISLHLIYFSLLIKILICLQSIPIDISFVKCTSFFWRYSEWKLMVTGLFSLLVLQPLKLLQSFHPHQQYGRTVFLQKTSSVLDIIRVLHLYWSYELYSYFKAYISLNHSVIHIHLFKWLWP